MPKALRELFIQQASDHLIELEPYLLELEVAGEESNSELLGRIFRIVHSIRGGACLIGLEDIRNLTRMLECVIGLMRNGALAVSQDTIRTILRSCDVLQQLVQGEASPAFPQVMPALSGIAQSGLPDPDLLDAVHFIGLPDGRPILHISGHELEQCKTGDVYLYVLEFDLHNDVAAKQLTALGLLEYLQKSGHVLGTHCEGDIEDPDCGCSEGHSRLYVLFSTILEPDLVNAVFMIDSCHIHQVDVNAVSDGAGALKMDGLVSNDACGGLPEAVTDAPIEGVEELMAEYDRTLLQMQEASRVPFEPWDDYDGENMTLSVHSGSYDALMNGLPLSHRDAPRSITEQRVFDDLAPVDEILDGYDIEEMSDSDAGINGSVGAGGLFGDAIERTDYSAPESMAEVNAADTTVLSLQKLMPEEATLEIDTESADDISEDVLSRSADKDGEVPFHSADSTNATDAVNDASAVDDDASGGSSEQDQLDALELEFEAALLAEAKAAGMLEPQEAEDVDSFTNAAITLGISDSGLENTPDADPDADLFADSGKAPDLSYLTVPVREGNDAGGVMLTMEDTVDTVHGFSVVVGMGEVSVNMAGDLTITNAARTREALLDLLQEYSKIELDMRETEAVDVTFIQVLLAAHKRAVERGISLMVREGVSEAARKVFRQCGLDEQVQKRLGLSSLFVG